MSIETHDDFCERIDVDVGPGFISSPCSCHVRNLENCLRLVVQMREAQRNRSIYDDGARLNLALLESRVDEMLKALGVKGG